MSLSINLVDFSDIVTAVTNELKIPLTDSLTVNRIKFDINMTYRDEVVPFKKWYWLLKKTKVIHQNFYGTGVTVNTVNNSTTITLSSSPDVSLGSFAGQYFSTNQFDEIYDVATHTAGSTTVVLSSPFLGPSETLASFKIWNDQIALPQDLREVQSMYHQRITTNMSGVGFKEFREIVTELPKQMDFPFYFHVNEFTDLVHPDDELDSERFRYARLYPSISQTPVTIDIDYIKKVSPLVDDGDEPLMPIEDRIVLVYGALSKAWSRERNPEEASRTYQLYQAKLARMAGKIEDGFDEPKLSMDTRYMGSKRGSRLGRGSRWFRWF